MKSIEYIKTQVHRLSSEQRAWFEEILKFPSNTNFTKVDEERICQLYLWLHMEKGNIKHRNFSSSLGIKGRKRRY